MFGDSKKVDEKVYKRILYLKEQGLTQEVIATRLGISARTVRVYLRAAKTGTKPYEKPDVQPEDHGKEA